MSDGVGACKKATGQGEKRAILEVDGFTYIMLSTETKFS